MIMFYFQSTRMLELTLNMEAHVIHLKQDTLCLFNLAVAGCASGALVDLFELACGYSESEEQKKRVKEFKKLERQFSDHDKEITILDPEQDEQEQAKIISHPSSNIPLPLQALQKRIQARVVNLVRNQPRGSFLNVLVRTSIRSRLLKRATPCV